jgi:hypothetical protein
MEFIIGIAVLLAAKFLAYGWYLGRLSARWQAARNPYRWALARIAVGAALAGLVWLAFPGDRASFLSTYFVALGVGRLLAWGLIIVPAFGGHARAPGLAGAIVLGVALSYVVEIPILMGWIQAIGGIC